MDLELNIQEEKLKTNPEDNDAIHAIKFIKDAIIRLRDRHSFLAEDGYWYSKY